MVNINIMITIQKNNKWMSAKMQTLIVTRRLCKLWINCDLNGLNGDKITKDVEKINYL